MTEYESPEAMVAAYKASIGPHKNLEAVEASDEASGYSVLLARPDGDNSRIGFMLNLHPSKSRDIEAEMALVRRAVDEARAKGWDVAIRMAGEP